MRSSLGLNLAKTRFVHAVSPFGPPSYDRGEREAQCAPVDTHTSRERGTVMIGACFQLASSTLFRIRSAVRVIHLLGLPSLSRVNLLGRFLKRYPAPIPRSG